MRATYFAARRRTGVLKLPANGIVCMASFIRRRRRDCQKNPANDKKFILAGAALLERISMLSPKPEGRSATGFGKLTNPSG